MKHKLLLILTLSLGVCISMKAQTFSDSVMLKFRQSKIDIVPSLGDNKRSLDSINSLLSSPLLKDSTIVLRDVNVVGGASPEGTVRFNEWLSRQRAEAIYKYVGQRIALPDSLTSFTFLGRDWEGLKKLVLSDHNVPDRDIVLSEIDAIIESNRLLHKESPENVNRIKRIGKGVPYRYMYRNLFPILRESKLILTFDRLKPERIINPYDDQIRIWIDTIPTLPPVAPYSLPVENPHRPFYMALKSNMLSDVLAVPEIGAEFYLGKNMSIVGNWMYGWWDKNSAHRYWRLYGGDIALRWWFGKAAHEKPLTGHHVGIYAGVLTYDFEFGGKGYMGGLPGKSLWDRCMRQVGIEYGYSLPIARRWNIDFTLGVGYLGGKYEEYVPMDKCYVWQATKQKTWIGPTKLEISLTWLLGRGNYNKQKGGGK